MAPEGTREIRSFAVASEAADILRGKKLVFIVGAPRSGTTWLEVLLSRSDSVIGVFETDWFSAYARSFFEVWEKHHRENHSFGLHRHLTDGEYFLFLRTLYGAILSRFAKRKPSATIILEKTPAHAIYWRDILRVFPEAHFIHLVRDPRAVVASLEAASKSWAAKFGPRTVSDACEIWIRHVEAASQISSATSKYIELRYRDLANEGANVLKTIFDWVGVSITNEACQKFLEECNLQRLKSGSGIDDTSLRDMPADFFRRGERDGWRSELSSWDIALIEKMTVPWMNRFGFPLASSHPLLSVLADLSVAKHHVKKAIRWRLNSIAARL